MKTKFSLAMFAMAVIFSSCAGASNKTKIEFYEKKRPIL